MAVDEPQSDSTTTESDIADKIERIGEALERDHVPQWYFNAPDLYDLELERIFGKSWIFVGHETEIPNPGDYALRTIGEDPFIFVRDENGDIQLHFNSCRHRGTQICRSDEGNASHFRCPYHGWTYNNEGELVGVPQKQEGFPDMDKEEWSLSSPTVDTYKGLVFARISEDGPTLDEYLGDVKWYLDMDLDLMDGGLEVVGEPHRYEVDVSWKARPDNASGDNYHVQTTHLSNFETGVTGASDVPDPNERNKYVRNATCGKHSINLVILPPQVSPGLGYPDEMIDPSRLGEERAQIVRRSVAQTGTIFPNFSWVHLASSTSEDSPDRPALNLRKWQPRGPNKIEMINWILVPKNASEEYKREAYRAGMANFSPSGGNFEADDLTMWASSCRAAGSHYTREKDLELNWEMDNGEGRTLDDGLETENWPGTVFNHWLDDNASKNFHKSWYETMTNGV